jgi:molybdopterin-guanine dinucleotide biosynthesis protein A
LIDIVVDTLSIVTEPVIIVGGTREHPGAVLDVYPGEGPLGGLITGLEHLGPGVHVAAACDMPLISPEVLKLLMRCIGQYDAVVPDIDGGIQPLCAVYRGESVPELRRGFGEGERSIRRAVERIRAFKVPEADLRAVDPQMRSFINVNSLADLEALESVI